MGLKPVGSEKLQGAEKIKRIIDIANYGLKKDPIREKKFEYIKEAKDGNTYVIVKEKDGYHIKMGINESSLDYINGIDNKNKNRFSSYSGALKRLNLLLKPINEEFNNGKEDHILNETKYVLKKDKPAEPDMSDMGSDDDLDLDLGDDDLDLGDDDLDLGDDDLDLGSDEDLDLGDDDLDLGSDEDLDLGDEEPVEAEPEIDRLKKIQKLTGKLGQELREYKNEIDSKDIKYVLNSVLSAIDLTKLNDEDLEDVMENFEELENFEVQGGGSDSLDLGDEQLDLGSDDDLDLDLDGEDEELSEVMAMLDEINMEDELYEDEDEFEVYDRLNESKLSKTIDNILSKYRR